MSVRTMLVALSVTFARNRFECVVILSGRDARDLIRNLTYCAENVTVIFGHAA